MNLERQTFGPACSCEIDAVEASHAEIDQPVTSVGKPLEALALPIGSMSNRAARRKLARQHLQPSLELEAGEVIGLDEAVVGTSSVAAVVEVAGERSLLDNEAICDEVAEVVVAPTAVEALNAECFIELCTCLVDTCHCGECSSCGIWSPFMSLAALPTFEDAQFGIASEEARPDILVDVASDPARPLKRGRNTNGSAKAKRRLRAAVAAAAEAAGLS